MSFISVATFDPDLICISRSCVISSPPDSEESRKQLNDILMKRKESLAELRQRIAQSTLRPEDLRINRPPYRKTSDLFASESHTCQIQTTFSSFILALHQVHT